MNDVIPLAHKLIAVRTVLIGVGHFNYVTGRGFNLLGGLAPGISNAVNGTRQLIGDIRCYWMF